MGTCHDGTTHPQAADGGMASNMEGSYKYIEYTVAGSRQGVVLQIGGWVSANNSLQKKMPCYKVFHKAWTWTDLWYKLSKGKGTRDSAVGTCGA